MRVYNEIFEKAKKELISVDTLILTADKCKNRFLILINSYLENFKNNNQSYSQNANIENGVNNQSVVDFEKIKDDVISLNSIDFVEKYGIDTEENRLNKEFERFAMYSSMHNADKNTYDASSLYNRMLVVIKMAQREWKTLRPEEKFYIKLYSASKNLLNEIDGSALLYYDNLFETNYMDMNKLAGLDDEELYRIAINEYDMKHNADKEITL